MVDHQMTARNANMFVIDQNSEGQYSDVTDSDITRWHDHEARKLQQPKTETVEVLSSQRHRERKMKGSPAFGPGESNNQTSEPTGAEADRARNPFDVLNQL